MFKSTPLLFLFHLGLFTLTHFSHSSCMVISVPKSISISSSGSDRERDSSYDNDLFSSELTPQDEYQDQYQDQYQDTYTDIELAKKKKDKQRYEDSLLRQIEQVIEDSAGQKTKRSFFLRDDAFAIKRVMSSRAEGIKGIAKSKPKPFFVGRWNNKFNLTEKKKLTCES